MSFFEVACAGFRLGDCGQGFRAAWRATQTGVSGLPGGQHKL